MYSAVRQSFVSVLEIDYISVRNGFHEVCTAGIIQPFLIGCPWPQNFHFHHVPVRRQLAEVFSLYSRETKFHPCHLFQPQAHEILKRHLTRYQCSISPWIFLFETFSSCNSQMAYTSIYVYTLCSIFCWIWADTNLNDNNSSVHLYQNPAASMPWCT